MSGRGNNREQRSGWAGRVVLVCILALVAAAVWLLYALFAPYQGFPGDGVFVEVPRGAPQRAIARLLEEKGVVRSRIAFEALCRWRPRRALQAGEYFFDRPRTALEVFQIIAEGRVYMRSVTVPEGLTMLDIADLVEREELCHREDFLAAARDPSLVHDLAPRVRNLEGFLFPATYEFPRRVTAQEIVGAMVKRFREVWSSFPEAGRNPHGLSALEVVTMASLVERETGVADERPVVAGVFYNRLRRGVALQCDPTVIYALRLANRYDGALDEKDLAFKSPYNTYRHRGLPPGPIANPGAASLRAVLHPPYVDYLYFVSNTQGGHFFSKTLEEHNGNVARYRRLLAEIARAEAQRTHEKLSAAPPTKAPRTHTPQ